MASTSVVPKTRSSVNSGGLPRARRDFSKRITFVLHAALNAASNTSPGIAASLAASSICGGRDEGLCSLGAAADGKMRVALPRASASVMI